MSEEKKEDKKEELKLYCLSCKKFSKDTQNIYYFTSKHGRKMVRGSCGNVGCGKRVTGFPRKRKDNDKDSNIDTGDRAEDASKDVSHLPKGLAVESKD